MLDDRSRFAGRILGSYAAERVAGIVSLLDDADAEERARLVRALSVPPTRVSLEEPWRERAEPLSPEAQAYARYLEQALAPSRDVQILSLVPARRGRFHDEQRRQHRGDDGTAPPASPEGERKIRRSRRGARFPLLLMIAQVRLANGAVATFRHVVPTAPADRPLRLIALVAISGVTVALLAGWAVRRLTRPLATLADAATGLARNLDRPPLPESGPIEVSRAARAFNTMQRELKAYLETRSQALAAVSHDLRLPLTRARLRLERIGDAQVKASLDSDFEEMEHMIGGTLEFLRAGASGENPILLNLNALLEGVAEDIEALGARVRVHGRAEAPLHARAHALRRCLANLMDNARRHGGGDIDVTVLDSPQSVRIRIEDRGPSIAAAERERVFEPYVRLEPSRARHTGGSGLGLAIARAVARAHGGDIALSDRGGGGLCAELTLPRVANSRLGMASSQSS
ncbi:MAG: HAMP domain-containing protein [Betaproteobacteria bacterium]|nr:HAMP domain-containing protein [Betaproteobacteria bacterium]